MAAPTQARLTQLLDHHSLGNLSSVEEQELATLIERGDQLMLRKAETGKLLYQRGYP